MSLLGAAKMHENKKQNVPLASERIKAEKKLATHEVDTSSNDLHRPDFPCSVPTQGCLGIPLVRSFRSLLISLQFVRLLYNRRSSSAGHTGSGLY
jgi:hypothetical protein